MTRPSAVRRGAGSALLIAAVLLVIITGRCERSPVESGGVGGPSSVSPGAPEPSRAGVDSAPAKGAPANAGEASGELRGELPSAGIDPDSRWLPAGVGTDGTLFVILEIRPDSVRVARTVRKPGLTWSPGAGGRARFVMSGAGGAVLGRGFCRWPRLCSCGGESPHGRGCVKKRHRATLRLKLPLPKGPATVALERRLGDNWKPVTTFAVGE